MKLSAIRNILVTKRWLIIKILVLLMVAYMLKKCSSMAIAPMPPPQEQRLEVRRTAQRSSLFFTGTIKPLQEKALVSPMDAVVEAVHYHYGQRVEKGAVIFSLNSAQLQQQYHETLTEYLKAKDNFHVIQAKFNGTEDLWKAGLIAKNNYLSEKSNVDMARISLMQASTKVKDLLEKTDEAKTMDYSQLNLADFDKVQHILSAQHNRIQIRAESSGILLYPPKNNDDKSANVGVGAAVKSGQALALLGNMQGIRIEIDVPEVDIQKIQPGMKAIITGVAMPGKPLLGELVAVNAQAFSISSQGLPSFSALVEMKQLSAEDVDRVKVGMSAAIELLVEKEDALHIPLAAVKTEQGTPWVLLETKDGKRIRKNIQIAATEAQSVKVKVGLQDGDVLIYE